MPRLNRIYTRKGDDGTTRLGGGQKVRKDTVRVETYGTVDELNSQLGLALSHGLNPKITTEIGVIQNELFDLGSDLCVLEEDRKKLPVPRIEDDSITRLEALIDRLTAELGPLENFILPGGSPGAAALHVARTVCRRAERLMVTLAGQEEINPVASRYINRLSDALFVLARYQNRLEGVEETIWKSRRR